MLNTNFLLFGATLKNAFQNSLNYRIFVYFQMLEYLSPIKPSKIKIAKKVTKSYILLYKDFSLDTVQ